MVVTIDEVVDIGLVGLRLIVADLQNRIHALSLLPLLVFTIIHPNCAVVKGIFCKEYEKLRQNWSKKRNILNK